MTGAVLLQILLFVVGIILAILAAIPANSGRISLGWLSVACLAGALLVPVVVAAT